jgi:AcrR family transcriptional regulator
MTEAMSRVDRAAATRARVVDSARTLFLLQGYAATTTRQVAGHAKVTERTLFNIVATKSQLLREVLLSYVFTDDFGPLLERQDFAPVLRAASVDDFLAEYSKWVVSLHTRTADLAEMTRAAASIDAGAAEIWRWGNAQQVVDLTHLAAALGQRGWLPSGTAPGEVGRSLAVLSGHESYWRLVTEEHWSRARYRRWLHRHVAGELAGADKTGSTPRTVAAAVQLHHRDDQARPPGGQGASGPSEAAGKIRVHDGLDT